MIRCNRCGALNYPNAINCTQCGTQLAGYYQQYGKTTFPSSKRLEKKIVIGLGIVVFTVIIIMGLIILIFAIKQHEGAVNVRICNYSDNGGEVTYSLKEDSIPIKTNTLAYLECDIFQRKIYWDNTIRVRAVTYDIEWSGSEGYFYYYDTIDLTHGAVGEFEVDLW